MMKHHLMDSTALFVPDAHIPFHDEAALDLTLEVIDYVKPKTTFCMGDWADQKAVSRHPRRPGEPRPDLDAELATVRSEWQRLERAARPDRLKFITGNHDIRYALRWLDRLPEFEGLMPSLAQLYDMDTRVQVFPYQELVPWGPAYVTHDVGSSGKHASSDASGVAEQCLFQGHAHVGQVIYDGSLRGRRRFVMTCGFLGDAQHPVFHYASAARRRSWQLGFGWARLERGVITATFCPIVEGRVSVEGKTFGSKRKVVYW